MSSPPSARKIRLNNAAPITMVKTMALIIMVDCMISDRMPSL